MAERNYFIVVRLFKDWEDQLDIFGACYNTYKSLRLEINPMDITNGEGSVEDYVKWNLLHQENQFDTLVPSPTYPDEFEPAFKVYVLKDLTREDTFTWLDKLRVALYADPDPLETDTEVESENENETETENESESENEEELSPTYSDWMDEVIANLYELRDNALEITVPNTEFDRFNFSID